MLVEIKLCTPSFVKKDAAVTRAMNEENLTKYTDIFHGNDKGHGTNWTLETSEKMSCTAWTSLVAMDGIAIVDPKAFKVKEQSAVESNVWEGMGIPDMTLSTLQLESSEYLVRSKSLSSAATVLRVCRHIHEGCDSSNVRVFAREEFSLRIPCSLLFGLETLVDKIERGSGIKGYVHKKSSLGFYLEGSNDGCCPTFTGTFQQLEKALSLLPEDLISSYAQRLGSEKGKQVKRCALRVCAPRETTLASLTMACHKCQDHPGTLGVDMKSKAFFAVKSVRDMKIMLSHLSRQHSTLDLQSDRRLKVLDLTYPKGVF